MLGEKLEMWKNWTTGTVLLPDISIVLMYKQGFTPERLIERLHPEEILIVGCKSFIWNVKVGVYEYLINNIKIADTF